MLMYPWGNQLNYWMKQRKWTVKSPLVYNFSSKVFQIVCFSIKTIFLIIKVYLFWKCVSTANEFEESIIEMKEANWSSDYANGMFRNFGESLISSRNQNYTGLIFSTTSLLLTFLFFFIELGKRSMYSLRV